MRYLKLLLFSCCGGCGDAVAAVANLILLYLFLTSFSLFRLLVASYPPLR